MQWQLTHEGKGRSVMARTAGFRRWASGYVIAGVAAAVVAAVLVVNASIDPIAAQTDPIVVIAQSATLGAILTGVNGKTLYVFDADTPNTSNCNTGCIEAWPALLLAAGDPVAPPTLTGVLTTFTRADGGRQVAYEGRPLYFFSGDTQAGDTTGDGIGGVWHVARPVSAGAMTGAIVPMAPAPAPVSAPLPMPMPTPTPPPPPPQYEPGGGMY
jgi:predicted lipoprotein with Yx(FWY)xxD motif